MVIYSNLNGIMASKQPPTGIIKKEQSPDNPIRILFLRNSILRILRSPTFIMDLACHPSICRANSVHPECSTAPNNMRRSRGTEKYNYLTGQSVRLVAPGDCSKLASIAMARIAVDPTAKGARFIEEFRWKR